MTIALWVLIGVIAGLLSRVAMPLAADHGNRVAATVGVCSAIAGGTLAITWTHAQLGEIDPVSVGVALVSALYILFAYRCLALRQG